MKAEICADILRKYSSRSVTYTKFNYILNMEGKNVYFRCISLFYFRKGKNASQTHKKICAVYGENAVSESVCRKWFAKFRCGDLNLQDAPRSGRPVTTDVDQIKTLIDSDRHLTTTEIGHNLNIDQSTVSRHLRKLGMEWVPTYGYKRAKAQEQKEWLIEAKHDSNLNDDPFAKAKEAKQEKQSKNELQRLRNIAKSKNIKLPKVGLPTREHFPSSQHLSEALTVARISTASVGKFQPRLPKEKDAKGIAKEVPGMKRKLKESPLSGVDEKRRNKGLVDNILKSKTKVLRDDYLMGSTEIKQTATSRKKKKAGAPKRKNAKKPKAGKGKRNLHTKVNGRKRR